MAISGKTLISELVNAGYDGFTGVPCSFLTPLLNSLLNLTASECRTIPSRYVAASSEGEAVGIAAGMWLAGRHPVVMAQNSGLGNMVNPITSLLAPFRIPILLLATWRGSPNSHDEPQHELMGKITMPLCEMLSLEVSQLTLGTKLSLTLRHAHELSAARRKSSAIIISPGDIAPEELMPRESRINRDFEYTDYSEQSLPPSRATTIRAIVEISPADSALISTTGMASRELFELSDSSRNFYVIGSMGCASAVGLGVSLHTSRKVIVIDGDGAALMKLGNLSTIGASSPENLIHIILDNGVHDSTGGQPTSADGIADFALIARALGYRTIASTTSLGGFINSLQRCLDRTGPSLIHAKIASGSLPNLGRPTIAPEHLALRFREFMQ